MKWFRKYQEEKLEKEVCEHAKKYIEGLYECKSDKPCDERFSYGHLRYCRIELNRHEVKKK